MKITIGFSKPINHPFPVFSWIIRSTYNTPYSHTYVKFYDAEADRHVVYESVGVGSRFIGIHVWEEHAEVVQEFELTATPEQFKKIKQLCYDHAGLKYGKMQIVGIYIAKLFRMKKNIFKNDTERSVCSEIVGRIAKILGYKIDKDFDLIVPKDIYKALN